ncbi:MAG: membrane protein insertion efficiency factor YidD [Finegoldia sp.]|nr:membrane protein insertion efficiency factor YidD [Finegoldia sp.]
MKKIAIRLIKFYQAYISVYLGQGKCRFYPTCSQYAIEAFQKKPFFKALLMTIWRILRCNPFSKGGYDPVK